MAGNAGYCISKGGARQVAMVAAAEGAASGVRCNVISPTADTRMTQRLPGERRALSTATPPEAIAPVVTFLASDHGAHITGQIVGVRGPEVTLFSHPAPLRTITTSGSWTGESLAEVWDRTLGQDRLRRFDMMKIPWPPEPA